MGKLKIIAQNIQDWFKKQTVEQKQRLAIICTIVFAVFLTISVFISMGNSVDNENTGYERIIFYSPVPAEEIFLPDEPDFVPGVLLERERNTIWTEQDGSIYWQDPMRFGEELWRDRIEAAINELLERVQ